MRKLLIVAVIVTLGAGLWFVPGARDQIGQAVSGAVALLKSPGGPAAKEQGKGGQGRGGGAERSVSVETAEAEAATTTDDIRAVGGLESDESVQITTEIAGRIAEIAFKEGQAVKAGDILVKLDDALVKAEVADAEARFKLAEANLGRANALGRTGIVTGKSQDEAVSNFGVAEAALDLARVRFGKHTIRAPFDGVVGIRRVSPGAYVAVSVSVATSIVNLEKLDPLKVDFKVPEVFLSKIATGQDIEVSVDALPGRTFTGTITAIDPHVDVNGRALSIRARLPNKDGDLRPGLFARIVIKGKASREVVTVPESAIVPRGGETFVFRVEDGKAVETKVALGKRANGRVEIETGLGPKATVVTAGQQKLRNGAVVDAVAASSAPPAPKGRRS